MSRDGQNSKRDARGKALSKKRPIRRRTKVLLALAAFIIATLAAGTWVGAKAITINSELKAATALVSKLKAQIADNDAKGVSTTVDAIVHHTGSAKEATQDSLWKASSAVPWFGPNIEAVTEVATAADDVARLGAVPLGQAFQTLDWKSLTPTAGDMDLRPLALAQPKVRTASYAVRESLQRLNSINTAHLLPQVAIPLAEARADLSSLRNDLAVAADAAELVPAMLGEESPRRYLLLVQNNAESRATGGIPGALAVLKVDKGNLSLDAQTSAAALGAFTPSIPIDSEQNAIFSARTGRFMQDVNLTPDFPTTATLALTMWEKRTGEKLDGAVSLDPVALSFILEATGPVAVADPLIKEVAPDLPFQLTSKNVVKTLLSDAYAQIEEPSLQDVYFAAAAKEIFGALSSGKSDPKKLLDAITRGVDERRILLWSGTKNEQEKIVRYSLGGAISGPAVSPAQFGIYVNDGTGGKMDYWVKRTVQVVRDCTRDGYREVTVRVTSSNTAPLDAATALPGYVTGRGVYGVPAGTVQTNIVSYGPTQATVDTVLRDGKQIPFTAQRHSQRPVGTSTIRLGPGESTTLDFNFGHIVQNADPQLVVTPTTQPVKDVRLAPELAPCE